MTGTKRQPGDFVKSFTKSALKKAGALLRPFFPVGRVEPMEKVIPSRPTGGEVGFLGVRGNQKFPRLMPTYAPQGPIPIDIPLPTRALAKGGLPPLPPELLR